MKTLSPTADNAAVVPTYNEIVGNYEQVLTTVDDIVLKNYICRLEDMEIVGLEEDFLKKNLEDNVLFFKITEMVYEKDEFASHKFVSVFNTIATTDSSVFILIDSNGVKTDFYMGIRSDDEERTVSSVRDTVKNALAGQFPGIKTTNYTIEEMKDIMSHIGGGSVSSVSCIADTKKDIKTNKDFVQGLEKLVLSMQNEKYKGIILANSTKPSQIKELRRQYETIYTSLSPLASTQINLSNQSSTSYTEGKSIGTSTSHSENHGSSESTSQNSSTSTSTSRENAAGRFAKGLAGAASIVGSILALTPIGIPAMIAGGALASGIGMAGSLMSANNSTSDSTSEGSSSTVSNSISTSESKSTSTSESYGSTSGTSKALTLTQQDKTIAGLLGRIDRQIKRLDEFESLGMYECAAYFISDDQYAAEVAASTYKALMRGENSGIETDAINSWGQNCPQKTKLIKQYVTNFVHPVFRYNSPVGQLEVTPCSFVSGNELAIHMGLPRHSVCGLPVAEHADFGKEIVEYGGNKHNAEAGINLGKIYNMGGTGKNPVVLNRESLSMHTFVTGSTGSGKSNTVYEILRQLNNAGINFMVIEPAKGEYKNVFGNVRGVSVYGTNPRCSEIIRINPFDFPEGIHVLEHIDRLVEIFNVCWPMYAAMPAVLKDSIERAYTVCGWNLNTSECRYKIKLYPSFADVLKQINEVMENSFYSADSKGDYKGALCTRLKSLTNGLYRNIFTSDSLSYTELFDRNVIVDLSRTGSGETKSLIMGLLVMKLQEYRISCHKGSNEKLKHITVLEEAHNLLKRTSSDQSQDSANLAGKSVEMLANQIAEMRTYGEGFLIADQAPGLLDMSVIRNTNTKIILRLPDLSDRELVGRAASLNNNQISELSKLETGVAAVYQNNWLEAVLCKVNYFKAPDGEYVYTGKVSLGDKQYADKKLIDYILSPFDERKRYMDNINELEKAFFELTVPSETKVNFLEFTKTDNSEEYDALKQKIIYDLFNAEETLSLSAHTMNDVSAWSKFMIEHLSPDISKLDEKSKSVILSVIVYVKAGIDENAVNFANEVIEYIGGKLYGTTC